jgi:hypothetical protein
MGFKNTSGGIGNGTTPTPLPDTQVINAQLSFTITEVVINIQRAKTFINVESDNTNLSGSNAAGGRIKIQNTLGRSFKIDDEIVFSINPFLGLDFRGDPFENYQDFQIQFVGNENKLPLYDNNLTNLDGIILASNDAISAGAGGGFKSRYNFYNRNLNKTKYSPYILQYKFNGDCWVITGFWTAKGNSGYPAVDLRLAELSGQISNLPFYFAGIEHLHSISEIVNLESTLLNKSNTTHTHTIAQISGLDGALNGKSNTTHTHSIAQISGLDGALNAKANASETPTIAQLQALSGFINNKAEKSAFDSLASYYTPLILFADNAGVIDANNVAFLKQVFIYGVSGSPINVTYDAPALVNIQQGSSVHFYVQVQDQTEITITMGSSNAVMKTLIFTGLAVSSTYKIVADLVYVDFSAPEIIIYATIQPYQEFLAI